MNYTPMLAREFGLKPEHAENIINLIDEGNTIPFIARYRKELTGACDDQVLRAFSERLEYVRGLDKRKDEVRDSIDKQGKLTPELSAALDAAVTLAEVEDIYRPYKQKRRTRATIAQEKGLAPLADEIMSPEPLKVPLSELAAAYIDAEKGVSTAAEALDGARDIIAERISDDAGTRKRLRELISREGLLTSKAAKTEDSVYAMYYDYSEPVSKIPSHRVLAINRGEREEYLKAAVEIPDAAALPLIYKNFISENRIPEKRELIKAAADDSWKRLIFPSVEREIRAELTEKASAQAIAMFGLNLKPLLMSPPLKDCVIMGLDPAFRTGCKIAVIDKTGKVLDTAVVYPTPPQGKVAEARAVLTRLIKKHGVRAIAIGNGTASKKSEIFVADMIRDERLEGVGYMVVNEAGASVYSASKLAAEEFPEFDLTLRSAVSIARRLQDPLAELVKIDPKSIGVGQYQHDMPQAKLDETLSGVVEDCVNRVGVDLNTASPSLLSYVSGLGAATAKNIVAYRDENGRFTSREQLKKVPKLGPKAFEQCAGFLRIPGGENILDNTSVHPESYAAAEKLLKTLKLDLSDAASGGLKVLPLLIKSYGEQKLSERCGIGIPTLRDIVAELEKPGRDIRDDLPAPSLRTDIMDMNDLQPGMELTGTVRNVIDFGVFVDIGVHQDGLVHISRISDRYIKHPSEVVKVGDVVKVWVLGVDAAKKRISLTMKKPQ